MGNGENTSKRMCSRLTRGVRQAETKQALLSHTLVAVIPILSESRLDFFLLTRTCQFDGLKKSFRGETSGQAFLALLTQSSRKRGPKPHHRRSSFEKHGSFSMCPPTKTRPIQI